MYIIELYEDTKGNCELEEYFNTLKKSGSKSDRIKLNKIRMYINLLSEYGLELNEPYIKKIDSELWELRPLRDRILFASWYNNRFILLSYFMKQTARTPKHEINKAKRFFNDYKKRNDEA